MAPTTRFPIFTIIEINDSIQSLTDLYFAIIDLATTLFSAYFNDSQLAKLLMRNLYSLAVVFSIMQVRS